MKLKNLFFLIALLSLNFLSSCGDKDEPSIPSWGENSGLTVKEEVILSENSSQTLNIKASVKPTVTTDASWLKIGEVTTLSTGIYSVELKAEPNGTGETRTAEVTVTAGKETAKVKVTQVSGDVIEIKSIDPEGSLNPEGGSIKISYVATAEPVLNLPEWITQDNTRSLDEGIISLSYEPNNTGSEREALIVLAVGKAVANVTFHQDACEPSEPQMGSTAMQLAAKMYAGINIGNTMETPDREGSWNCPVVNRDYVKGLKALGFNAVRVPCAWNSHVSDAANNTIDAAWLDRVDEVIGWIVAEDMYAILNIHWDGGWLENSCANGYDETINQKQHDYWTQIAKKLNHYDERLLLAAMNEPNVGDGSSKKKASIEAIMKYQQTMLDAVRATGGNNASRVLVMQGPNTDIDVTLEGQYDLPTDVIADRLMIETHFYGPYQFNMMEKDESWGKTFWYWGKENHVAGSDRNSTWGEEDYVADQMQKMKKRFIDKGIPGIIGEYAVCYNRENTAGIDKEKWRASVRLWNKVVTRESKNAGMVPFFWETGGDINRANGNILSNLQLDGVFEGASEGKYPF